MSKKDKTLQIKQGVKMADSKMSDTEMDKLFMVEYEALCKRLGRVIAVEPYFKYRDDGTYSILIRNFIRRNK